MSRRLLSLAAISLLLLTAAAGLSVAAGDSGQSHGDTAGYTLSELQTSGEVRDERYPSMRVLSPTQYLWTVGYKTGLQHTFGEQSSLYQLKPQKTIKRNRIQFKASHPYDGQTHNYTVRVIYWHQDTKTVQTENGTIERSYANVTGQKTQVITFEEGPRRTANISLTPHYNNPEMVTIHLLDENGDVKARWGPYVHKSIETTQTLPFTSWEGFFPWFGLRFLVTFSVGGVLAVFFGIKMPREAAKGPGKGMVWWLTVSAILTGVVLFGWWAKVVALVVAAPYLLAGPPILLVFIASMEFGQEGMTALLEKAEITKIEDPLGEQAPAIVGEEGDMVSIVDVPEGYGFVKDGSIKAFLARYFAGVAVVSESDIPKEVPYGGASSISKKFYVDGFDFTRARWTWRLPSLRREVETDDGVSKELRLGRIVSWIGALVIGTAVSMQVWGTPYVGLVAGAVPIAASGAIALPAEVEIDFADNAKVKAKAARLTEQQALAKWETFGDLADAIGESQTEGYDLVMDILDDYRDSVNDRLDTLMQPNGRRSSLTKSDNGDEEGLADGK